MLFRKLAVMGAAFAGLLSFGVANAADLGAKVHYKAPAPAQYVSWTGPYVGLSLGYHDGTLTQSGCVGFCPNGAKLKGPFLAIQGGYDYQFSNNIVVGISGLIPLTVKRPTSINIGLPGFDFTLTPKFVGNLNVRVGYAYQNILPYVFGGLVYSRMTVQNPFNNLDYNQVHNGVSFGAGVEYAINRNWSLDARYAYIHSPKKAYDFGGGPAYYGEDSHNLLIGVNYRFR